MSVADMITQRTAELQTILNDCSNAVVAKGGEQASNLSELQAAIESIPEGAVLPTLTNPATAGQVLDGKEYIDSNGTKQTGTLVVCDTIEEVGCIGMAGAGVSVDIESSADGSTSMLTLREPKLLPENIKSDVNIFGLQGTYKGTATKMHFLSRQGMTMSITLQNGYIVIPQAISSLGNAKELIYVQGTFTNPITGNTEMISAIREGNYFYANQYSSSDGLTANTVYFVVEDVGTERRWKWMFDPTEIYNAPVIITTLVFGP